MSTAPAKPQGKPIRKRRKAEERRTILRSILFGVGMLTVSLLGFVPVLGKWKTRLRPPGALDEDKYLASCIKCGQCVQTCPVEAVVLADTEDGFGLGAAYIDARAQGCDFSCDALQCVLACPTGALSHDIDAKEQVRMGIARLAEPGICLARQGKGFKGVVRGPEYEGLLRYTEIDRWTPIRVSDHPYDLEICDLCVRHCPIEGAISLEPSSDDPHDKRKTPVVHHTCVGCGTCEMMCPTEPAAIVIDARRMWGA